MANSNPTKTTTKRAYSAPALTTYGSVRELTGGSSLSGMADGGVTMNMV